VVGLVGMTLDAVPHIGRLDDQTLFDGLQCAVSRVQPDGRTSRPSCAAKSRMLACSMPVASINTILSLRERPSEWCRLYSF